MRFLVLLALLASCDDGIDRGVLVDCEFTADETVCEPECASVDELPAAGVACTGRNDLASAEFDCESAKELPDGRIGCCVGVIVEPMVVRWYECDAPQ